MLWFVQWVYAARRKWAATFSRTVYLASILWARYVWWIHLSTKYITAEINVGARDGGNRITKTKTEIMKMLKSVNFWSLCQVSSIIRHFYRLYRRAECFIIEVTCSTYSTDVLLFCFERKNWIDRRLINHIIFYKEQKRKRNGKWRRRTKYGKCSASFGKLLENPLMTPCVSCKTLHGNRVVTSELYRSTAARINQQGNFVNWWNTWDMQTYFHSTGKNE